jgi:acetoin utilization deacetylase AcuC-like enzyme
MEIYCGEKYTEHNGPNSSAENASRIAIPLDMLREKYPHLLHMISGRNTEIKIAYTLDCSKKNCPACTMLNVDCAECIICAADISGHFFNYVSQQEGDTTYIGANSEICLQNAIATIDSGISCAISSSKDVFLLIRPPGHHCCDNYSTTSASGFCVFNNIIYALSLLPEDFRVVIIDWDAHRGNGTQAQLVGMSKSVEMYDLYQSGIFPYDEMVCSPNIHQLPMSAGSSDGDYIAAFDDIMNQIVSCDPNAKPAPQMIFISCGFDGHTDDKLAGLNLTSRFYAYATQRLRDVHCPKVYFLEGGYEPNVIRDCIDEMLQQYHFD